MRVRKTLATLLSMLMLFTMSPISAVAATGEQASRFADMPDNWSSTALNKAVDNGLLKGYETGGKTLIKADAPLKRAEMAAIVNRAFGAAVAAELKGVNDVPSSAWYAKDMAKAVQMGTFVLDQNMRPESNITRQEAFTVLARAFKIASTDTGLKALDGYADKGDIAAWAQAHLNAMVAAGYIKGSPDGKLNPKSNITRAEFAVVMDNLVKQYIDKPGEVNQVTSNGNVMVRAAGITLKGVTVKGDLIIADGVGDGEAILDGVKVEGRTVVRGGGVNSIIIRGNSSIGTVVVARADGAVSVKVQGDANVEVIYIDDGSDDVRLEGTFGDVEVKASNITVSTIGAKIDSVAVSGDASKVVVDKDSKIEKLNVNQGASNISIEVAGTISTVTTQASETVVTGSGKIAKVEAKEGADNTKIETSNTQITVEKGVTGVTGGGGAAVVGGTAATNNNAGTGLVSTTPASGGGGGGGGGGTVSVPVNTISVCGEGNATAISANNGTLQMSADVEPANASNKSVTWSVTNGTGEATISSAGLLTAVKNGTVIVKATAKDGSGKFGEKEITISGQIPVISTTSTIANGAVNPVVVVTLAKDTFTAEGISNNYTNWFGNAGGTTLDGESITRDSDTQITFHLTGTAKAGTLTLQAKEGALTSGVASNTITITVPAANQVATPAITPSKTTAANREAGVTFSIAAEDGVSYYYTLDGSAPTISSTKYEGQVTLIPPNQDAEATVTIKAIGVKAGSTDSEVSTVIVTYAAKTAETVTISSINAAELDMRKGSIIMGYTFSDGEGTDITYTDAISDTYALDEDASTVALFKNNIQIGNTVKLSQLSIGNSDKPGESAKVTFTDFNALLTKFGLSFDNPPNPANIPDEVKVVIKAKTTVGGKAVENPWGPIEFSEPVTSDLYMDASIDPARSGAVILPGNKTAGQAFPIVISLQDAAGANLSDGNYMVEVLNGATPIGGGSVAFTGGQASVNALLASAGSHTLTVKVNNVVIEILENVTAVSSPILGSVFTTMDGTAIHLTFDKAMADPAGKHSQFAVTVNGNGNPVTAAALKPGDSNTIVLTLTTPLAGSETITIAYTQGDVVAADNGILRTFAPMAVTNNVPPDQDGAPAFTAGTPATFGTEMTVGEGTLVVKTNLTYTWYRSDDANYNEGSDTPLGIGTTYTPVEADIGKYLIVVATSTDATGIGFVATTATVEKTAGPVAIAEDFVGTFPSAATSINLSGFAASASGLEAAVAIDGSNYAGYADLSVNEEGKAAITGLTGVTVSTRVTVRVKETSTHKAGAEKEIAVTEEIISAIITPATGSFDKKTEAQADVTTTITWNSAASVTAVKNGGSTLTVTTDYTVAGDTLTIKKEYLTTLTVGAATLNILFDKGDAAALTITVSDTTPIAPEGDLLSAESGPGFTGALYARAGNIYYNQADATGVWGTESLIASAATEGRMAVDSTGKPHVAYTTSDSKIGYRMYDGSAWTNEVLIESNYSGACSKPDIAVDCNGKVHITYTDTKGDPGGYYTDAQDIMYATNASGNFVKTLIYNGYFDDYGGSSGHGQYYDKGSYITVDLSGNYYIMAHQRTFDKSPGFTDTYYYVVVKSNLGEGNISNYKYDIFDIYDLTYAGGKVVALYNHSGFKTAELTESAGTINFTNPQALLGTSVSSVITDGTHIVVGGVDTGKLQVYCNDTQVVYNDITVKGSKVSIVNSGGSFYAVYTDDIDGKIKVLNVAP
ncbi:MAG: hypothetical protein HPY66_0467 [Firmicutes bacterium]|nr:hypothetical protein [Bacillota bacterium]